MVIVIKNLKERKSVIKRRLKFNDYENCLFNNEMILKLQQRCKSEALDVYTNKIALSRKDDKRLQTFDKIISCCYGTSVGKVCKTELLSEYKQSFLIIILMKIKQNII